MSNPQLESAREFTVGSVLGRTKTILFTQPLMFMGLAFIALAPSTLVQILGGNETIKSLGKLINFIFIMIIQGAFAYGVFQIINGHPASFGASLSRGMTRFFSIVGTSILIGLGVGFGAFLPLMPGLIFQSAFLLIFGALVDAFLVPSLMCRWTLAIPACVVEHLGAADSLGRSAELTKGYRLKVLCLQALAYLLFIIFGILASTLAKLCIPFFFSFLGLGFFATAVILLLIMDVLLSLPMAFLCVTTTTTYYDLRSAKEGVTVDSLANVFD